MYFALLGLNGENLPVMNHYWENNLPVNAVLKRTLDCQAEIIKIPQQGTDDIPVLRIRWDYLIESDNNEHYQLHQTKSYEIKNGTTPPKIEDIMVIIEETYKSLGELFTAHKRQLKGLDFLPPMSAHKKIEIRSQMIQEYLSFVESQSP